MPSFLVTATVLCSRLVSGGQLLPLSPPLPSPADTGTTTTNPEAALHLAGSMSCFYLRSLGTLTPAPKPSARPPCPRAGGQAVLGGGLSARRAECRPLPFQSHLVRHQLSSPWPRRLPCEVCNVQTQPANPPRRELAQAAGMKAALKWGEGRQIPVSRRVQGDRSRPRSQGAARGAARGAGGAHRREGRLSIGPPGSVSPSSLVPRAGPAGSHSSPSCPHTKLLPGHPLLPQGSCGLRLSVTPTSCSSRGNKPPSPLLPATPSPTPRQAPGEAAR